MSGKQQILGTFGFNKTVIHRGIEVSIDIPNKCDS